MRRRECLDWLDGCLREPPHPGTAAAAMTMTYCAQAFRLCLTSFADDGEPVRYAAQGATMTDAIEALRVEMES